MLKTKQQTLVSTYSRLSARHNGGHLEQKITALVQQMLTYYLQSSRKASDDGTLYREYKTFRTSHTVWYKLFERWLSFRSKAILFRAPKWFGPLDRANENPRNHTMTPFQVKVRSLQVTSG